MTEIISGERQRTLAQNLARSLGLPYSLADIQKFADQELRVALLNSLCGQKVLIVQSTSKPANDNLMTLLLLVDAAKKSGASCIGALVPYFGYSRQDRPLYPHGPLSAQLVARMLESAGVDHLITVDLHSQQLEGFFKIELQNIDPTPLFFKALQSQCRSREDAVVVSPDVGALQRAKRLGALLGVDIALIHKNRTAHNTCQMNTLVGDVAGKRCILVDDIVDTAETLCKAAALLHQKGAHLVQACVTHPVLSHHAFDDLESSCIRHIFVSDSIPHKNLPSKFTVLPLEPLLKRALEKSFFSGDQPVYAVSSSQMKEVE